MSCNKLYVKKFNRNIDLKELFVPAIFKNSVYNRAFKRKAAVRAAAVVYRSLHTPNANPFLPCFVQIKHYYIQKKNRPGC